MSKLNLKESLSYQPSNSKKPETVFEGIARELEAETEGYIIGIVQSYDGPVESYISESSFSSISRSLGMGKEKVDIQNNLGEIGFSKSKFEFYLTTPKLSEYKYRMLFFEYGIGGYPVKIVLEQGIADEIYKEEGADYILTKNSERELESTINAILTTKKALGVMQELINASNLSQNSVETPTS